MSMVFYNTLTRKKEAFIPLEKGVVKMYTCGPTVYNHAHIGNFRAYIFEDQLKRYLKYKGFSVTQVMNITDVDDKIIRNCSEKKMPLEEYTRPFKESFFKDLDILNIDKAEVFPAATKHIGDMVKLIQSLLDKGLAYRTDDGNIFFKITAFPRYGRLQNLNPENLRSGGRVENDEYEKESVHDFALWKAWKPEDGEVCWNTPLGKGRPGWHIECSAMSMKYLGETFDIHTGGVDNIFPHHENEIAQSEGATGKPFARYWLHCEHLLWDGEKMSKSLGNMMYIRGLTDKGYSPTAIRYALLSTHYRQKLNFSLTLLDQSEKSLKRVDDFLFELDQIHKEGPVHEMVKKEVDRMLGKFEDAMDDDLNISPALASVFEMIRRINRIKTDVPMTDGDKESILAALKKVDQVLGVIFSGNHQKSAELSDESIEARIAERDEARKNRDWARADVIRDELLKAGIELIDRKEGTTFRRK
ncbi:TPA: cysteine--tRNA ligase [Candidatus Marinimicrobia bacterium]|nr:MAG: cysteinyl-tRNA synthetase [Marinimicrobia bacterium 46_47]HAE87715.1 cysteine--tRNA ligase [Candidatus Neomarinimicrobiota bacterium]